MSALSLEMPAWLVNSKYRQHQGRMLSGMSYFAMTAVKPQDGDGSNILGALVWLKNAGDWYALKEIERQKAEAEEEQKSRRAVHIKQMESVANDA